MSIFINARRLWHRSRNQVGLRFGAVGALVGVSIIGNALCFRIFDSTNDTLIGWGDALWYSVISITTIGYGDFYAVSLGARLGTIIFIIILGLFAFTMLLGILTEQGINYLEKGRKGMGNILDQGHLLIVNYPGAQRLQQLLHEIWADNQHSKQRVVLVSDTITETPNIDGPLEFIHGSPLDHDSYQRAAAQDAAIALILPADYNNSHSDAITASAMEVLSSLAPQLKIVAECLDKKRSHLFTHAGENTSIVCGNHMATNMMIQELADPGVAATMEEITSNRLGATLYTTTLSGTISDSAYIDFAQALLPAGINVIAVTRNESVHTLFNDMRLHSNDALVYIANERKSWVEISALASSSTSST